MHLHCDNKRVGAYLGNYLSTFFCVLIFIRIDPNLRIVSKRIKLIRTNIYKVLQFIRVNFPNVNGTLIGGPTYLLISEDDKILQFCMISISFFMFS